MDLLLYKYDGWSPRIRPGGSRREWMDGTNERYAYRCLPLTMANSHGWELLSPCAFEAKWNGTDGENAVDVRLDPGYPGHLKPVSLFGYGTMTWHVEGIFRTPPGWNLWVSGPPNRQKDAIQPLSGMIETDWSPYTFTMNWRFTRTEQWVRFEENEPIAFFFPVERRGVERWNPKILPLEGNEDLKSRFEQWSASRTAFQKWVRDAHDVSPSDKWQKLYFRGLDVDGRPGTPDHQSKLRLPGFKFPDGKTMDPPEPTGCPMRHGRLAGPGPDAAVIKAEPARPANALINPAGNGGAAIGAGAGGNPGLALALNRIGFAGQPPQRQQAVQFQVPAKPDRTADLALKRRNWIMDVQAKQRRLSSRAGAVPRVRDLSADDFLDSYYSLSRPVVLEGALADWPAVRRWTPDYLAQKVGDAPVELQGDRGDSPDFELYKDRHKRRMPFDRFIARIEEAGFGNDAYITAYNSGANRAALAPLRTDLDTLDRYLTPGEGMMWIGPMGTFTPLHFDLTNNLIAQVVGSKRIVMLPPSETPRLYNNKHVFSAVHDVTDDEMLKKYPLARDAETFEVELEAGDALLVPIGWWHQVTALDFSVTLTYTNFRWPNEGHADYPAD